MAYSTTVASRGRLVGAGRTRWKGHGKDEGLQCERQGRPNTTNLSWTYFRSVQPTERSPRLGPRLASRIVGAQVSSALVDGRAGRIHRAHRHFFDLLVTSESVLDCPILDGTLVRLRVHTTLCA